MPSVGMTDWIRAFCENERGVAVPATAKSACPPGGRRVSGTEGHGWRASVGGKK
ncbi:MAG TPA: hypothetical protein VMX13_02525 [Sedimentisphaerales bacterium]|nr:hypothetical protein [Sedimentisphaerales bacterium]